MNFLYHECTKTDVHLKGKIELSSDSFAACSHIQEILLLSVCYFLFNESSLEWYIYN